MISYTTTVKADKTVFEIQQILSKHGASKIMLDYEAGKVSMICFQVEHRGMLLPFKMPANVRGVQKALSKKKIEKRYKTEDHAYNVAWRVLRTWIEAQLSLIESEQADLPTVMLPYSVMQNGKTVAENLLGEASREFLLDAGNTNK